MQNNLGYAVVDVETSGLAPANDRVLEIAVILLNQNCETESEWSTRIRQPIGQSVGPKHIHGLSWWSLRNGISNIEAMATAADLLRDRIMVAHNAPFDAGFIRSEAARCGLQIPITGPLCTLAMSRKIGPPKTSHKLATLCERYGVSAVPNHRALDDARACAQLLPIFLSALGHSHGSALLSNGINKTH